MGMSPIKKNSRHSLARRRLLRLVKLSPDPVTAAQIMKRVPTLSAAATYRNLKYFTDLGEIMLVEGDDGIRRYVGHTWHEAEFRCVRCGRARHLKHRTLPGYVDRKMFGRQVIITSQLKARGLCGECARR